MASAHSFSFSFSSTFSSKEGVKVEGSRTAQHMYTDENGQIRYKAKKQNLGEPAVRVERKFDRNGREIMYDERVEREGSGERRKEGRRVKFDGEGKEGRKGERKGEREARRLEDGNGKFVSSKGRIEEIE